MTLQPGDPAPGFVARASNNPRFVFDAAAGRYLCLTFLGGVGAADLARRLAAAAVFDDRHASLFFVTASAADEAEGALPLRLPGVRAFFDRDGAIARLYGHDCGAGPPRTVLISPRLQIGAVVTAGDAAAHAAQLAAALAALPAPDALPAIATHAPVLVIPEVFEPALCRALIAGYDAAGGEVSGFMRDIDGRTRLVQDPSHKVRRDWVMPEDHALRAAAQERFLRRVVPEIAKAFQFQATRMERYIVCCYDAGEGGHFRPHRDNTTKGTAHRRFAVTLNLNDDYEGGALRFPEFGAPTYRPPAGGALVFSCSLLHEATRVTAGRRFVFLPFLYDEAARRVREENAAYVAARP